VKRQELLRSLGLSPYEAEVYDALGRLGRAKVLDIARQVSVPRPQVYVALKKLAVRGLCTEVKGKVSVYVAVDPGTAFEPALAEARAALERQEEGVRSLAEAFERAGTPAGPDDFVQVLRGAQVRKFMDGLYERAREQVLVFFKYAQARKVESLEGGLMLEQRMLKRGLRIRCLYELAALEDEALVDYYRRALAAGELARVVPTVPMNALVFDDTAAAFSLPSEREGSTVFVFSHPALVATVKAGFEFYWQAGRDLGELLPKR
jgi:sugar-specific transcriptional regulator TrmB